MEGNCSGAGNLHHLLIKKFKPTISIRKSTLEDAKNVALVHVQAWQQSYENIITADYLNNISLENRLHLREKILRDNSPEQVHLTALHDDKIIGFCDAGPSFEFNKNYRGEIYAIYLLKEFKGLGIGKQLLKKEHQHLIEKNLFPYIAWVLKDNKIAREFYERNNGILLEEKFIKIGDRNYPEVAYIFREKMLS
jgi:GNAT superfamily N-acetyltransferase